MLLRRKTCFMAAVKSVLLQIAALCVTGQFQPGFLSPIKIEIILAESSLSTDAVSSSHSPSTALLFWKGNELSNRYHFFPFSGFTAPSHYLLKSRILCSHTNTGTVREVQHPFHCSIPYKRNYGAVKYCKKTTIKKDIWGEQRSSATDELSSWCRKCLIYTPSAEWIGWTKVSTSAQGCMALITAGLSGLHMLAEILTMRWINTWKHLPAWRHKAEVLNNDGWTSEEIIGSI